MRARLCTHLLRSGSLGGSALQGASLRTRLRRSAVFLRATARAYEIRLAENSGRILTKDTLELGLLLFALCHGLIEGSGRLCLGGWLTALRCGGGFLSLPLFAFIAIVTTALTESRTNETGGSGTNQVLAPSQTECLAYEVRIFGLLELKKRALKLLFTIVGANIDTLACSGSREPRPLFLWTSPLILPFAALNSSSVK